MRWRGSQKKKKRKTRLTADGIVKNAESLHCNYKFQEKTKIEQKNNASKIEWIVAVFKDSLSVYKNSL